MPRFLNSLIGLLIAAPSSSFAVEVDDRAAYYAPLRDSTDVLNAHVNELLQRAASATKSCNAPQFEAEILKLLTPKGLVSRTFFGGVEKFAEQSALIEKHAITLEDSIYRNTPFERGVLIVAGQALKVGAIFPSIRLADITVGTDKLSHFFETGHDLFDRHLRNAKYGAVSNEQRLTLLKHSIDLEEDYLGWALTGIKSFADIDAHLQGAYFWHELLSEKGGWWTCKSNRLTVIRQFDFRAVVHEGWSEAINCNDYVSGADASSFLDLFKGPPPPYLENIEKNAAALEAKTGQRYQCPIDVKACHRAAQALHRHFPDLSSTPGAIESLLSPLCVAHLKR